MNITQKKLLKRCKEKAKHKALKSAEREIEEIAASKRIKEMSPEEIGEAFQAMAKWAEEDAKKPWTREQIDSFQAGLKKIEEEAEERERIYRQMTTMSFEKFHKPFDL